MSEALSAQDVSRLAIAVVGAGAVGCYYGGRLAQAGHAVTLIGRAQHVDAIRNDGLLLETRDGRERIRVDASTGMEAVDRAELILVCVKSTDTDSAARELAPHVKPGSIVLSLQNGVDNAQRLQQVIGKPVEPVVVYVATEMAGPGHVRHHGRGELVIGPSPASERIVRGFASAGVAVQVSDNVAGALWAKLVVNCAFNAISAIAQQPYGTMIANDAVTALVRSVVDECLAVAQREGIAVPGDGWQAVLDIARTMPTQMSSTAQDIARGRRTEIEHLNGYVVRRGRELGVATPANQALYALVKLIEERAKFETPQRATAADSNSSRAA